MMNKDQISCDALRGVSLRLLLQKGEFVKQEYFEYCVLCLKLNFISEYIFGSSTEMEMQNAETAPFM